LPVGWPVGSLPLLLAEKGQRADVVRAAFAHDAHGLTEDLRHVECEELAPMPRRRPRFPISRLGVERPAKNPSLSPRMALSTPPLSSGVRAREHWFDAKLPGELDEPGVKPRRATVALEHDDLGVVEGGTPQKKLSARRIERRSDSAVISSTNSAYRIRE